MWIYLEKRKGQENECSIEAEVEGCAEESVCSVEFIPSMQR